MIQDVNNEPHEVRSSTLEFLLGGRTPDGALLKVVSAVYTDDEDGLNGTYRIELKVCPKSFGLRDVMAAHEQRRFDLERPHRQLRELGEAVDAFFSDFNKELERPMAVRSRLERLLEDRGGRIRALLTELCMMER